MAKINTTLGEMDESELVLKTSVLEDDDKRLDIVEYCTLACTGEAHRTGVAQGDGSFCEKHVHRSVHLTVKRMPEGLGGVAASLA